MFINIDGRLIIDGADDIAVDLGDGAGLAQRLKAVLTAQGQVERASQKKADG